MNAETIQSLFQAHVPSLQEALVEFNGSQRVYMMFADDKQYKSGNEELEMPGKVSPSVYKALKMRQLGEEMRVRVLHVRSTKKVRYF